MICDATPTGSAPAQPMNSPDQKPAQSPDHGTAPNIAGKNIARPAGMIAAINLAAKLTVR